MKEKLLEMLQMQQALNENILKEHGSEKYTDENLEHAFLDELGELNHELKPLWCWWKKTQKPVDQERLLEEYVDCIHFGLCMLLNSYKYELENVVDNIVFKYQSYINFKEYATSLRCFKDILNRSYDSFDRFVVLLALGDKLGFDFDTIYEAYIKKNKVNYERLKNGY